MYTALFDMRWMEEELEHSNKIIVSRGKERFGAEKWEERWEKALGVLHTNVTELKVEMFL